MALSFLGFGKKKPSPDADSSNDNKPASSSDDDYVVIERRSKLDYSMYPVLAEEATTLPYYVQPMPTLPGQAGHPTSSDIHQTNPLDDVPFKLSSHLSGGSYEWSRSDAAHFKSLMSSAVHHNETVYKYDFSHENSIMRESN